MSKPAEATVRNRVLTDPEIATLWRGLSEAMPRSIQCQRIIKLCLVTAQRVGEVAGIAASELDLHAREWRLPAARTKNGHPHVVPLSDLAIELITEAIADQARTSESSKTVPIWNRLFPCGQGSLSPAVVARAILRAHEAPEERPIGRFGIAPWSAHDLRRTALTGMARLGVVPIVLGHIANHRSTTRAGVTLSVYSQYSYDREKRAALDLWAERLQALVGLRETAELISFRQYKG
jgi:integrase